MQSIEYDQKNPNPNVKFINFLWCIRKKILFSHQLYFKKKSWRKESFIAGTKPQQQLSFQEPERQPSSSRNRERSSFSRSYSHKSIREILEEEMKLQKSKKRRRRRSDAHRQEEVYTDKDRAAAVNMGTRDIKQSLKLKRKQDRSRALQIPEEADPSSMLAHGLRELRCGNVRVAVGCIDKVSFILFKFFFFTVYLI